MILRALESPSSPHWRIWCRMRCTADLFLPVISLPIYCRSFTLSWFPSHCTKVMTRVQHSCKFPPGDIPRRLLIVLVCAPMPAVIPKQTRLIHFSATYSMYVSLLYFRLLTPGLPNQEPGSSKWNGAKITLKKYPKQWFFFVDANKSGTGIPSTFG